MEQGRLMRLADKYRPLCFLVVLLICSVFANGQALYNPTTGTVSNKPYSPAQAVPTDSRSYKYDSINFIWRPYASTSEVLSYLSPVKYRWGNYIIVVDSGGTLQSNGTFLNPHNTYYMFADSTTNGGLVKLNLFGNSGCGGCLLAANNLSDLANAGTARSNLGLGSMAQEFITATSTDVTGTWPNGLIVNSIQGHNLAYLQNYANLTNTPPLVSLTTTGTSGVATYNSGTGVLNIPNYSVGGGGSCLNCNADTIGQIPLNFTSFCNNCVLTLDSAAGYAYWAPVMGGTPVIPPNIGTGFRIYAPQVPGFRTLICNSGCTIDSTTNTNALTFNVTGGGTGTVTAFTAGNLSPIFTTSVATGTTTPALTFALSTAPAFNVLINNTGSPAAPVYAAPTSTILNSWFGSTIASVPSAGLVYSTGTALADVTVLAPLLYSGGVLSADTLAGNQNLATQGFITRSYITGPGVAGTIPYWQTPSKLGSTGMVNDTTNKRINFGPSIFVQGSGLSPDGTPVGITTYSRPDTVLPHGYSEGIQEYSFVAADSLFYAYIGVQSWPYVLGNTAGPLHGKFPGYVNGFSSGPLWDGSLGNGNKNLPVLLGYFSALNSQNGSVTNAYDYYASELNSVNSTSNHGNFTNHYAFYAEAMDSATHNYGLYITHADSNYMWGNLKLPSLVQRIIDTSNLKVLVGDNLGNVFKMYWPTAGAQTLTYTQLALNNTLSISGGNTQTFLTATHSLAGLMDTASKAVVDSLKARTYTWPTYNIYPVQGISAIGVNNPLDSFKLGGIAGAFFQPDTIVTNGFAFSITGLPSKATALSTDSVLIENVAGQIFKLPVPSGGGGAVSSVSNSDGTLTISPTTGAVVASLNLGNANTWTANQSFPTINLSGNIVFTGTTATSTVGSLSDIAAKVFTRGVSSDGDLTNSAGTGARVRDQINGVDKFDILSTGQLQVPAGYGTSFGGATSDSVLTLVGGNIRVLAISSLPSGGGGGGIGVDSVQTDTTSINTTLTQTTGYNEIIVNPSSTISSLTLTTATVFHSSNDLYIRFGAPGGNIAQGNPVVTAFFLSAGSGLTLWGNFNPSGQTYNSGDLLRIHKIGSTLYFTHN